MSAASPIIAALATAWGASAISVVRLSGPLLRSWLAAVAIPRRAGPWRHGQARRVDFQLDGLVFDDGLCTWWEGPRSYTGEDCAELSCHGNPLLVEMLLRALVDAGARLAEPGEFTRRAVENGKLDLVRAEAVLQATSATSAEGLAIARAGLDGRLSAVIRGLTQTLRSVVAGLEASLDHPEEAEVTDEEVVALLRPVVAECRRLAESERTGRFRVQGARVALVGAVNAGKSSLFNALVGRTRALVHDQAGTTRDVLELAIQIDGLPITLLDTAGERTTSDPVEAAGLALARDLVEEADLLVVVLRARGTEPTAVEQTILERTASQPRVVVVNGVDVAPRGAAPSSAISVSARTGTGIDELTQALKRALVGETTGNARLIIASARQRELLLRVARAAESAGEVLPFAGPAVAAEELTEALAALDALTGVHTREAVLDTLFERFCIGK